MNRYEFAAIGMLVPFIGTTLGSALVFFLKEKMDPLVQRLLLGFASGVMIAASVWSLILPSIEMAGNQGVIPWLPAAAGFIAGVIFLLALDRAIPSPRIDDGMPGEHGESSAEPTMLMLAITLHNIPEGMAVGVVLAGALTQNSGITYTEAFALSMGIAIQNLPEGAVISMPFSGRLGKVKSFWYGTLSGAVEPVAAVATIALTSLVVPVLPYILAFAAGAMIYVVIEELIPEAQSGRCSKLGTIGASAGFVLMMVMDVALG